MERITEEFVYGSSKIKLESGMIARQASAAVFISMGDTSLLVTVVGNKEADITKDFFPLSVHYQERAYASGKIPSGFFKRENRPGDHETLISRLIDRPLRPLFPEGFNNEIQITATVISADPEIPTDIPALLGASAALAISGIPFNGPIGAARVGYIDHKYTLNPTNEQLTKSNLELVVAGTEQAVLMVESEAKLLSEKEMLGSVMFAHEQMQVAIKAINNFAKKVSKPKWNWEPKIIDHALRDKVTKLSSKLLTEAYQIADKSSRREKISNIKNKVNEELLKENSKLETRDIAAVINQVEKSVVRQRILNHQIRIDNRGPKTVRELTVEPGKLPKRVHGSALFTRGETQVLATCTLGTERDAQRFEYLGKEQVEHFMLHYNFPPYCVGETGMLGYPKRREIGHGRLARRGIAAVLPDLKDFPYTIRAVAEVTESNGSSSMASVCATSLALMDAGVPITASVAGIAMGLIKEGDKFVVLSDILGDEDHLGDMDFKVAGTKKGITALQMDIKIEGVTKEIMEVALNQAKDARLHILCVMDEAISIPRKELSDFAPCIYTMKIDTDRIRDVIGKGGATIRALTEETGTNIELDNDGTVRIAATDAKQAQQAIYRIEQLTADIELGKIYIGKVVRLVDFGAFVNILPGKDGLVHISQIAEGRVNSVADHLSEGDEVKVKVLEIDRQGRVRLSIKATL